MTTRVLIDCDPGIDDAVALLLAFASPELSVEGVTAVAGNTGVAQTTANAARVLDLAGAPASLPLASGYAGPLARPVRIPDEPVHGPGGLGEIVLPASSRTVSGEHAVDRLAADLAAAPGELTVVAVGPLTNIAGLFQRHPVAMGKLRELVVMGGAAFAPGNVTPVAEFNFYADPEAARYVLESGVPVRLVPLDVTRRAMFTRAQADALVIAGAAEPEGATAVAGRILGYLADRCAERSGVAACPVHDALAVAAVIDPDLLEWTPAAASVECAGELTRGALVADVMGRTGRPMTTSIATGVNAEGFAALLAGRLASYA